MMKRKIAVNGFNINEVVVIIVITSIVSALLIGTIITNNYRTTTGLSYRELLNDENVKDFLNVYSQVVDGYYEDVDKSKVVDSAIQGMMGYLGDNYSSYLNSEATNDLTDKLSGVYKGIGITIDGTGNIVSVFDDTPAKEAGLAKNDKIISINGIEINESNYAKITEYINENDESVNIGINRDGTTMNFNVRIDSIISPSIISKVLDVNNKKIGYLYIESFTQTLKEQVEKELDKMNGEIDSLIIDVRNNGGGYLKAAEDVASMFIEKGKMIYSLESKNGITEYKDSDDKSTNYPIIVLINRGSASASEILAAALKESYGATLIGTKSYGKGLVQVTYKLDDGSMAKYSSAKWLTPNGNCVEGNGIEPDHEVEITKEDITNSNDSQFNKAVEILSGM